MENRIAAIENTVGRHESVIETLRGKLDEIHAGLSRLEAKLSLIGSPGVSEFCRQHMRILDGFSTRIEEVEKTVRRLDNDLTSLKIKISVWVASIVVVIQFVGPYLRKLLGLP